MRRDTVDAAVVQKSPLVSPSSENPRTCRRPEARARRARAVTRTCACPAGHGIAAPNAVRPGQQLPTGKDSREPAPARRM